MRALTLLLLATTAYAQVIYEIKGTVIDPAGIGIAEANVMIGGVDKGNLNTKTDARGNFRITVSGPGTYLAGASKEGYFGGGITQNTLFQLDSARPSMTVSITLSQAAEIGGRVLDEETRQPVPGLPIHLLVRRYNWGQLSLSRAPSAARTDDEGRFRFIGLPSSADYVVSPSDLPIVGEQLIRPFTKGEVDQIDEAYDATYWPGGVTEPQSVITPKLNSGGYAEIGTVYVRKVPQYRVHLTLDKCEEGGSVRVSLLRSTDPEGRALGVFPCGTELLLKGFRPGSYALYANPFATQERGIPDALNWGYRQFEVTDKNVDLLIPLQRGTVIEGQIKREEGVPTPQYTPSIFLRPADLLSGVRTQAETFIQWEPDQEHFHIGLSPFAQTAQSYSIPGGYIKEVRLGGLPLRDRRIEPGSVSQRMEIIIDNKFGIITGTVRDGTQTVANAAVILVQRNAAQSDQTGRVISSSGDGSFRMPQMAPGIYSVLALPAALSQRIHEPGVLDRLLATAPRITLSPSANVSLEVRLSDVR